jgi:hypothetical protein
MLEILMVVTINLAVASALTVSLQVYMKHLYNYTNLCRVTVLRQSSRFT